MMEENRKVFKAPIEELPKYLEEQERKYGSDAHVGGICPETGNTYKEISSKQLPGLGPLIGADKTCSECGRVLNC